MSQSFSNCYEIISFGRTVCFPHKLIRGSAIKFDPSESNGHSEPNLFISVVAADGDDVHVRSTMRKITRAAQHHDPGSCLPSLPSPRTASRNRKYAVGITALLPASIHLLVHVSVMQWKSFMQMVQITDGQIAVLIIEKSYKFKKMMHFLTFRYDHLLRNLAAKGHPANVRDARILHRIIRTNPRTRTLLPYVFLKQVPGMSVPDKHEDREHNINDRVKGPHLPLGTWYWDGFWSDVQGGDKSIDHPQANLYDPDLCPISDLVGKGRSAWAYRLYLASATRRRFLRDRRVTQLDGIDLTDKSRADLAFSRFFWRMRMWDLVTGSGLYRGSKRATGSLGALRGPRTRRFTVLVAENYSEGVDPRVDYDHDGTCRPMIHRGPRSDWSMWVMRNLAEPSVRTTHCKTTGRGLTYPGYIHVMMVDLVHESVDPGVAIKSGATEEKPVKQRTAPEFVDQVINTEINVGPNM
ncbi:hypothetical protein ARMSODRAFT_1005876 [Armillaria solidipes]|uniref:Uncharacterized protein n=1 Tax=Armillaria solidipes TaxID=1076256 RepID=A0A2H3B7D0_9AGAR|nr:hypothetical protein ARMSODRAFT_1005876 [Armillaria solidipes]